MLISNLVPLLPLLAWTPGPQDWEQGDQELPTSRLGGSSTTATSRHRWNGEHYFEVRMRKSKADYSYLIK